MKKIFDIISFSLNDFNCTITSGICMAPAPFAAEKSFSLSKAVYASSAVSADIPEKNTRPLWTATCAGFVGAVPAPEPADPFNKAYVEPS